MDVQIRRWRTDDAEALAKALNNKKILDNLRDGIPYPYTVSDAEDFITAMLAADENSTFAWAITVDGAAVGSIGAFRKDNVHRLTAEMGYYVAEEYWGKGVATKAIREVLEYLFKNTDIIRVFAQPYAFNAGSCRALEKNGFTCEGTLRSNAVKNGRAVDMKMYAILKEDYI